MPKRALSGLVSSPDRVVAPISVKGLSLVEWIWHLVPCQSSGQCYNPPWQNTDILQLPVISGVFHQ